jgi:excisionase family DNA binding protein
MKTELNLDLTQLATAISQEVMREIRPLLSRTLPDDDPVFDVDSLAKYLRVGKQWVYQKLHAREIPHYKMGKYPRFRKSKIDEWLDQTVPGKGKKR